MIRYILIRKDHGFDGLTSYHATAEEAQAAISAVYPDAVSDPSGHGNYFVFSDQSILDDGGEPVAKIDRLVTREVQP